MKTCTRCGVAKDPESGFYRDRKRRDGRQPWCRECSKASTQAWAQTPAGRASRRAAILRHRFGMTPEEYERRLAEQGGVCAICGDRPTGRRLDVDHDHRTGAVRGLLCSGCNTGIGSLRDDPEIIRSAVDYLERAHAHLGA